MAGLATLKKDALMYLVGMMLGMFVFGEIAPAIGGFMQSGFIGEEVTLPEFFGLSAWIVGGAVTGIAVAGFWGAEWLEKRYRSGRPY